MSELGLRDISFIRPALTGRYGSERALQANLGHWSLNPSTDSHLPWDHLKILSFFLAVCKIRTPE